MLSNMDLEFIVSLIIQGGLSREKGFERAGDAFVNGLNELRRLHKNWGSIVMVCPIF